MTTPQERHSARDLTKRSSTGLLLLRAELEGEAIAGTITTERRSLLGDVDEAQRRCSLVLNESAHSRAGSL